MRLSRLCSFTSFLRPIPAAKAAANPEHVLLKTPAAVLITSSTAATDIKKAICLGIVYDLAIKYPGPSEKYFRVYGISHSEGSLFPCI